jgi:hypothetical protein
VRISVYLKTQDHLSESPRHEASRQLAALIVSASLARLVGQNAIQLQTVAEWREIKQQFRATSRRAEIPQLLPPLPFYGPFVDLPRWLLDCYGER